MRLKVGNKKGFTLVELLVVISIISIATTGTFSLIWRNISVQKQNKNFLVASMLAQEGLEIVRKIRDDDWGDFDHGGDPWYQIKSYGNSFTIDYIGNVDASAEDSDGDSAIIDEPLCRLYLNSDFYDHVSTGQATPFYRIINIVDHTSAVPFVESYMEVSSLVQWSVNGVKKEYVASTRLYDWK
jgi:prepilin-type N-terminal cleavage/methylation domain-containing protein